MPPGLILLAGTSESGKSTAGSHLELRGARRIKIRSLLAGLHSGRPVTHEGVPMREDFDHQEFLIMVGQLPQAGDPRVLVIESFIDVDLAELTRNTWAAAARIVFITATRANRITRLAAASGISFEKAATVVDRKDARKRVMEQWRRWRSTADDWIDNDSDHASYLARLDRVLAKATTGTRP